MGEGLDGFAAGHRNIGDAVGDVGAEAAVLHHNLLFRNRVYAELSQRGLGCTASALLGLGINLQGLLQGNGENLVFGLQGTGVGALL